MSQKDHMKQFSAKIGEEIGLSDWFIINQADMDDYGELTGDSGRIHNDPVWAAKETPFKTTIVQGTFLISQFVRSLKSCDVTISLDNWAYRLNYGFNYIRMINPIKEGVRFRGRFTIKDVKPKGRNGTVTTLDAQLEIEGQQGPAVIAEWLFYVKYK